MILQKHTSKIEEFAHSHESNPDWKLVSLSTAKQRLEILYAALKEELTRKVTDLPKFVQIEATATDISDEDFPPMEEVSEFITVKIEDVIKLISEL